MKKFFKKVGLVIYRWMLHSVIAFNALKSSYYHTISDTITKVGPRVKGPNPYQLNDHLLEQQVLELKDYIQGLKKNWKKFRCTIMCNGQTMKTKRPLINFMIYSNRHMIFHKSLDTNSLKKGQLIQQNIEKKEYIFQLMDQVKEVKENVVQIVTRNEVAFKAVWELLMKKRKHLYQTLCAIHCIDLILKDFEEKNQSKKQKRKQEKSPLPFTTAQQLSIYCEK